MRPRELGPRHESCRWEKFSLFIDFLKGESISFSSERLHKKLEASLKLDLIH